MPEPAVLRAELVIPRAWLQPTLTLEAVRSLQRDDTRCQMEKGDLHLSGVEVLVARNWILEEFWPRIQETLAAGVPAEQTYTFFRAHADRRRRRRAKA
ncbi:MAG TPA: hypothetical protein VET65_02265 [Candidatus Limnocylindrales bacterium]|nr:hypothetical protein [Candidatus Limnocylindrales bacterium]